MIMSIASIKRLTLVPLDLPDIEIDRAKSVGGTPSAVVQVSHMKLCFSRAFWLDLPPALELQPAQLPGDDFSLNFVGSGGSQDL